MTNYFENEEPPQNEEPPRASTDARLLARIREILIDPTTGEWRELQSCADAIQEISLLVGPATEKGGRS